MASPTLEILSERETTLLKLLGQGHTVKSAATITGETEYAANEVLRTARRKLGVASSREAARLLTENEDGSQENRDGQIGIEPDDSPVLHRWYLFGGGIMFASIVLAFAVLTHVRPRRRPFRQRLRDKYPLIPIYRRLLRLFPRMDRRSIRASSKCASLLTAP
ncbi:MAG: hypothetical protein AAFO28_01465 [Pseudomonadota bacterium]